MISALLINGVPIECINYAAVQYHVPATLILSILKIENGYVGSASLNKNGTIDYGPMQINSSWINKIKKYGYSSYQLQYNPCVNVNIGAWILAQSIASGRNLWDGVGNYHSHTFYHNQRYNIKVNKLYHAINQYLNNS